MINARAIARFLSRKLDSYEWLKKEPDQALDSAMAELPVVVRSLGLWRHQKVCLLILLALKRFMLLIDMGGGKTLLTLATVRYRKATGAQPRALVLVPFITAIDTWVEECRKHTPELTLVPLVESVDRNRTKLSGDGDIFVACYQSAVALCTDRSAGKWVLTADEVRARFPGIDMLVCDEIQRCKSVTSLTYRMCRALSQKCEWVIGLTGTPFGRDLQDLWPQFNIVDSGAALGPTLGFYREVFFTKKPNYWGGFEFKFKRKMLPDLQRLMKHSSISYGINDFADMPPQIWDVRHLTLPDGIKGYVDKANEELLKAVNGKEAGRYQLVESSYLQLRQLASGFMTFKGQDSTKVQVQFSDNPKLEVLTDLIEAMPNDSKMVIFHHFVFTNKLISDHLKTLKIGHARVWGGQRDPLGELKRFREDPACRVLIINSRAGSASLNLQVANFVVFFEQPDSAIDRQQAERRTWRPGQTKRVFYYDLLMQNTADERMYKANKAGENLLKQLLDRKSK